MKTIGLLGGLSWHSTAIYYQHLNQLTNDVLGGLHSASINMVSLNFAPIAELMQQKAWSEISVGIVKAAQGLQLSGADGIILANNTLHQIMPEMQNSLDIPCIHIADALGERLNTLGISTIGLLGTASTMRSGFYNRHLAEKYKVDVIMPDLDECIWLDKVIFSELCFGVMKEETKQHVLMLIKSFKERGAQAVALACTELPLLIKEDTAYSMPLLDTSFIHCNYAVNWSLNTARQ